ncbi:MAG: 4'-phosphopantetheinyl transferase family protein [Catenulispora sp.]
MTDRLTVPAARPAVAADSAPAAVALGTRRVHVALAPIPRRPDLRMLSAADRVLLESLPAWRRPEFAGSRALLRSTLAAVLGADPRGFVLAGGLGQPPAVAGSPGVRVSISHGGGYAAAAVSRGADVGVDVERWRRPHPALLRRWSTVPAYRGLSALAPSEQARRFTEAWVVQEACVKALRRGLAARPWLIPVEPSAPAGSWRGVRWRRLATGVSGVAAAVAVVVDPAAGSGAP